MDERISDLLGIVDKEITLYRDLIAHAREKTSLLSQGRSDDILENSKVEETFKIKLRFLENEMKRLCFEICQIHGIAREEFTLMNLAENLEPSASLELKSRTTLFRNLVEQLKIVSRRNLRLIEKSLKYSRGLLGLISNATSPYQRSGLFGSVPAVPPTFSHRV